MKKLFLYLFAVSLFSCQNNKTNNNFAEETENLFKPMVEEEINYISRNLEGLTQDKGKEWYRSDSIFFNIWMSGAREELKGEYNDAIEHYNKALKVKRYEISTYEVKLSLGRVYIQTGENEKARKMLTEFKQEAKKELSGEEVEWGLTEEAKEALTRDIEDCDYMLGMIDGK